MTPTAHNQIVSFIWGIAADLRALRQIERMRKYRTALIAEAATGNIDVAGKPN